MSDGVQTLDPVVVAKEFFLVNELLDEPANTPLRRWLEYQAYVELVRLVSAQDALPDGYGLDALDMESIRDWIRGIRQLPFSFVERMKEILLKLKAAGSGIFDEICDFYCAYKAKIDGGLTAASLALSSAEVAASLAQYKLDILLFHGIPVTTFASLAIKFGVLDDVCDCASR